MLTTLYGESVAISTQSKTFDRSFLRPRGFRGGQNIIANLGFRFYGTIDTSTAGLAANDFARLCKRLYVRDGAGDRRNVFGDDLYAWACKMLGNKMTPAGADIAASQTNAAFDFTLMVPFYYPGMESPDDYCMSVADMLNGGSIQMDFAAYTDLPADAVAAAAGLADIQCQILADVFEEVSPGKVRLRQRDLLLSEPQSGSRSYKASVEGDFLIDLGLRSTGSAGGTTLTNLTSVSVNQIGINAVARQNLERDFRVNAGVAGYAPIAADIAVGKFDPVYQSKLCPIVEPGFGARLQDFISVGDQLTVTTDESSSLSNVRLITHRCLPQDVRVNRAAIAAAGLDPNSVVVEADVEGGGGEGRFEGSWPYIRKVAVAA